MDVQLGYNEPVICSAVSSTYGRRSRGDEGDMSPPIIGQEDNIQAVPPIICSKTIKF